MVDVISFRFNGIRTNDFLITIWRNDDFTIGDGDRIAQMVISKHENAQWIEVNELSSTERGAGGARHRAGRAEPRAARRGRAPGRRDRRAGRRGGAG